MKYELQELDEIISVLLHPQNLNNQKNKQAFIKKCVADVYSQCERIKSQFTISSLTLENEKQVSYYLRQHQYGIIKLMDKLQAYTLKGKAENIYKYPALKSFHEAFKNLLLELNKVVTFISYNFTQHFDYKYKIPDYSISQLEPKIKQTVKETRLTQEMRSVDQGLIEFMLMPFNQFLLKENPLNQADLDYLFLFEKEVRKLISKKEICEFEVQELCIRLNLNDPAFTFYYIQKIKEQDTHIGIKGRIEFYYLQLKIINQIYRKPGIAYDATLPGIHDQLGTWLAEEIYFLEKKQQLEYSFPVSANDQNTKSEKVQTVLSVPQLSLAVKLLLDTGVIKSKHTSEVLRMVSKNFRTENSDQISEDSLRNKVYNIEPGSIEGMKNVIMGLWDEVRKY